MKRKGEGDNNKTLFAIVALSIVLVLFVTTPGWQAVLGIAPGSEGTFYAVLVLIAVIAMVAFVLRS